ncbi:YdcF family protein [Spirosoma oryzicola]|uniref:YdcF family protein n=1 Tax=Spirosoma oryzicola TaxID=2898794 RepID=UPI001E3AF87E|nr:YdcF family protein [Spirosoma oryzicola]UHG92470.1 YdcF family protein [Spirosoma oryzicola]
MFYFFSKTLYYLLTPAGWLLGALFVALFTRKARLRRRMIIVALVVFYVFGNAFLMNELALWWEYPPTSLAADSTKRVAIVLTGGMINGSKETPDHRFLLNREADRAAQALYLYKTGAVQTILISGGSGDLPFQVKQLSDEGEMTARFLTTAGVRPTDIVLERKSRNTHENALFTAKLLRARFPASQYVLVTSAFHMRRAVACFRKENVSVLPYPAAFRSSRRSFAPTEWLLPNEESFADAYYLVKELVGYTMYSVMGYS